LVTILIKQAKEKRVFFRSLQWRLVFIITAVTVTMMVFIGIFLNKQAQTSYYDSFRASIEQGFSEWGNHENISLKELSNELGEGNRVAAGYFAINEKYKSFAILDMGGNIKFARGKKYSDNPDTYQNEILSSANLLNVLNNSHTSAEQKIVRTGDSIFFDYATRIKLSDGDYILYFRYDNESWGKLSEEFNGIIIKGLIFAVIIAVIFGYFLARTITKPIESIMYKAKKIAGGDFGEMLEVKSEDEIGKLTSTFNYMSGTLRNTLSEVYNEKSKMETVLQYMTDGVLAFSMDGQMILTNPSAKEFLGLGEKDAPDFDTLSKKLLLGLKIDGFGVFEDMDVKEKTVFTNDRYLKLFFATITDNRHKPEGVVVVLQDFTKQEKLENMRREFVANVSHELRTPLTSIKSYAETLIDGALDERETAARFLEVIDSEADRMTRLVRDLLQLSRLDNQQMQWNMHETDFLSLVRSCADKLQMEAMSKKQTLNCYSIGEVPNITGDSDRIQQVIINITNNALKYTPEGGEITVYVGKRYNDVYTKITDNGIGIPEEDLPRIFERFYRVDKARSREMGGTGLGLAIAKEIAEAHGGSINITSQKGKGTEVTVSFPIKGPSLISDD
jgi:two-component system sensor histidine kinase VicK